MMSNQDLCFSPNLLQRLGFEAPLRVVNQRLASVFSNPVATQADRSSQAAPPNLGRSSLPATVFWAFAVLMAMSIIGGFVGLALIRKHVRFDVVLRRAACLRMNRLLPVYKMQTP